ncbi:MAG: efflux RND transporter periplasmic adaptor subunit [Hylemonella sp.]
MTFRTLPLFLASALLLAACGERAAPPAAPPDPVVQGRRISFVPDHPQLKLLRTAPAEAAHAVTVELPAKLVWNEERTQRIYAPFAGRVTAIVADVGQPVARGATLARLASPEFAQAQSETARAEADARLAAQTLARQRELFDAGIIARRELEQAEADDARARAEAERARGRTRLYGASGEVDQQLLLKSGMAGIVVERNINPGQELRPDQAAAGAPPLFVISDPTSLWIQIDAREADVGLLRPGTPFTFTVAALPGETFQGRVVTSTDYIDPLTRTIKVRGLVANPQRRLKAEMLATARFERRFQSGVMVPASAVLLRGERQSVFVQTRPGEFERRQVDFDFEGPKLVVIRSGVQPGEQVVVENALLLARLLRVAEEESRAAERSTPTTPRSSP